MNSKNRGVSESAAIAHRNRTRLGITDDCSVTRFSRTSKQLHSSAQFRRHALDNL